MTTFREIDSLTDKLPGNMNYLIILHFAIHCLKIIRSFWNHPVLRITKFSRYSQQHISTQLSSNIVIITSSMGCVIELVRLFMLDAELMKILFIFPFHYIMFENIASRKKSLFVLESLLLLFVYLKISMRNLMTFQYLSIL